MNKKYFWTMLTLIMAAFASVSFTACGNDDDDDEDNGTSKGTTTESLIGTWEMTHIKGYTYDDDDNLIRFDTDIEPTKACEDYMEELDVADIVRYEFGENNIFTSYSFHTDSFKKGPTTTYKVEGSTLILEPGGRQEERITIKSLTEKQLVLYDKEVDEYEITITLKRIK